MPSAGGIVAAANRNGSSADAVPKTSSRITSAAGTAKYSSPTRRSRDSTGPMSCWIAASPVTKTSEPTVWRSAPISAAAAEPLSRDVTNEAAAPEGRRVTRSTVPPGRSRPASAAATRSRASASSPFAISTKTAFERTP